MGLLDNIMGSAVGGPALGMILGEINDRRQVRQTRRLNEEQLKASKAMTDYQYQKQLEMWNATNYGAQVEHLKKAGLNPALLYGMSGGGGVTTGAGAAHAGTSDAPKGGGEVQAATGMAMQLGLLGAQKQNIEADTEKKKIEAAKLAGVDTKEGETRIKEGENRIDLIAQQYDNERVKHNLLEIDRSIARMEEHIKTSTMDSAIDEAKYNARKAKEQVEALITQNKISRESADSVIKEAAARATGALIENELKRQGIQKTKDEIRAIRQSVSNMIQTNMRDWDKMSQENQMIHLKKIFQDHQIEIDNNVANQILKLIPSFIIPVTK